MRRSEYYSWMMRKIGEYGYFDPENYILLLQHLDQVEYEYTLEEDCDRLLDGSTLLGTYFWENNLPIAPIDIRCGASSVLEMILALAMKMEEIKGDPAFNDRTGLWFKEMLNSLGLLKYDDRHFNLSAVNLILDDFMYNLYSSDGSGGLFTLNNSKYDLATVPIWTQAMWYLDEIDI